MNKHWHGSSGRPIRSQKFYRVLSFNVWDDHLEWTSENVTSFTRAYQIAQQVGRAGYIAEIWQYFSHDYRDGGGMSGCRQVVWYDGRKLRNFRK